MMNDAQLIRALTRLARHWPEDRMLFANSGTLELLITTEHQAALAQGGTAQAEDLWRDTRIVCDGGDR